jgi:bile acid:Na+ symporter, BASS family
VLSLVLFSAVGLAIGHALGGPDPDDRTVLALATATRHPGIAIAIASLNFPDQPGVMALVVYHLVIGGIVSAPYTRWRKKIAR